MVFMRRVPGRNILNIKNEIDRIYDEVFGEGRENEESLGRFIPAVNIEETDQDFLLTMELPGLEKQDVKITFQDGKLHISGDKQEDDDMNKRNFLKYERDFGKFHRVFAFPADIKLDQIEASMEKGLLQVRLPKAEEAKPEEIKINVK